MSSINDIFQVDYLPDEKKIKINLPEEVCLLERRKARSNTMGLQPHYIAKKEMIKINEQTTTKVKYPSF
jgi:hypothetical protein